MAGILEGRVAVVTGASAGIGEAVTAALADAGARVVANGRRRERLDGLAQRLGAQRVRPFVGDAADEKIIIGMLDAARETFGKEADLVVVNAGRGLNGSVLSSDPSQWEEMVRLNVLGAARMMREAGLRMLKMTEGKVNVAMERPRDIMVLGSAVGRHVSPFSSMYGGTKFAVHAMAEGVRRELAPKGIRVTTVAPGFVVSEFQGVAGYDPKWFDEIVARIGPALTPHDVARAIVFAASQPPHVHMSEILMRPTRQDYP